MGNSVKNHAVIGAFVVGAITLVVAAVVVFGGGKLFRDTNRFVVFFEGSVKGLNVGAPVTFRGVKIGHVMDISLSANPKTLEFCIPVVIEIDRGRIERTSEIEHRTPEDVVQQLIDEGLRAKLDIQSIITGQLLINMELLPDEPKHLLGVHHQYMELPTVPNAFERISRQFENLPFEEIVDKALASLRAFETLMSHPALPEMIQRLNEVSRNLVTLTESLNQRAEPLADSFQEMAGQGDTAMKRITSVAERIGHAADAMAHLVEDVRPAVTGTEKVMANVAKMTDPAAVERHELNAMLRELSEAARAVRVLAEYLERHPEALIRGKR